MQRDGHKGGEGQVPLTDQAIAKIKELIVTKQRQREIYVALRAGDAKSASAADLIHLAEGERWLEMMLVSGELSRAPAHRDGHHRDGHRREDPS